MYSGTHPVAFQRLGRVLLFLPKAVGALGFVKDVGCKFSTLGHDARTSNTRHMSALFFDCLACGITTRSRDHRDALDITAHCTCLHRLSNYKPSTKVQLTLMHKQLQTTSTCSNQVRGHKPNT